MLLPRLVPALDPRQLADLRALLERWAVLWGVPLLAEEVRIRTSGRLRRALGTYRASTAQITLAPWLLEPAHRAVLEEVLCHEAAHAAVHLSCGEAATARSAPSENAEARASSAHPHAGPAPAETPWARLRSRLFPSDEARGPSSARRPTKARGSLRRARPAPRPRPHGPEWRAFMETAGYVARVRFPDEQMPASVREAIATSRRWEHRCPVCDMTRMARTRVPRWRCRRCVEAGRSGRLIVTRRAER